MSPSVEEFSALLAVAERNAVSAPPERWSPVAPHPRAPSASRLGRGARAQGQCGGCGSARRARR